jgi:asparagine synthase (glutamine-hydrolysing)
MCGIFALTQGEQYSDEFIEQEFQKGKRRGPEHSQWKRFKNGVILGFHRLAINGLNEQSNQPICIRGISLICNGEIYNYKKLYKLMGITNPTTDSDCEVIIYLYERYGIEQTLNMLDGVFAFVLLDENKSEFFAARDPFGVRPLYYSYAEKNHHWDKSYVFGSEIKSIQNIHPFSEVVHFPPGSYISGQIKGENTYWDNIKSYFIPSIHITLDWNCERNIRTFVCDAVRKRCITTERPVACLLSGGLDSSLIAALVSGQFPETPIETYSIGLAGSEDLKYAQLVANHIESNHCEVIVGEQEMFDAIPAVIEAIESYDTTTIRASLGNYLIGKYIAEHSEAKVIFNGDGSDELFGGYLYMHKCPDDIEFDKETRRLLKDIHMFDVLRSDKCISSHGLEPRTPFLDRNLVNYVLSIEPHIRNHNNQKYPEKYLLRDAFDDYHEYDHADRLLPKEVLWRRKEAFSDGVCGQEKSLRTILQRKICELQNCEYLMDEPDKMLDIEKAYYRSIFESLYPRAEVIPYYWMPKYTEATDPSARTLNFYAESVV